MEVLIFTLIACSVPLHGSISPSFTVVSSPVCLSSPHLPEATEVEAGAVSICHVQGRIRQLSTNPPYHQSNGVGRGNTMM